jgi:hypothetical protein
MRFHPQAVLAALVVAGLCASVHAGEVKVSFARQSGYTDAGQSPWDEQATIEALAKHLRTLGQRLLPADQVLKIEVLDVDLAGAVRPSRRAGQPLRIVNGGADGPRIKLRYALETPGQALLSGEESVTDMDYAHGLGASRASEPLRYEKHMLDTWFKARFVERRASTD